MEHIYQYYCVFPYNNKGGNDACVFEDRGYSIEIKRKLAKMIGLSEIVFITKKNNQYFLQFFTPNKEIEMCGHATLAAIKFINERYKEFPDKLMVKEALVRVKYDNKRVYIDLGSATLITKKIDIKELAESMSIKSKHIGYCGIIPSIYKSGISDIMMPVDSYDSLMNMKLNSKRLIILSEKHNVVGLHAFTIEDNQIFSRNFAPLYEIDEEFATGTSNNSLIYLLMKEKIKITNNGFIIQGNKLNQGKIDYLYIKDKVFIGGDIIKKEKVVNLSYKLR